MTRKTTVLLFSWLVALVLAGCAANPARDGVTPSADRPYSDLAPTGPAQARAKTHVDLGLAYFQIGRYDVALDEARVALADDPNYPPAFHLTGLVYMFIDDMAAAGENFRRALRLAPGDPEFNNSYGWYLCLRGEKAEALERFALAARNPYYKTPTQPYANAGMCHLRAGEDAAAEAQFLRAVQADPTNTLARFHLAAIAYRRGAWDAARGHLVLLHQAAEPTAESAWLGLRTERRLGNKDAEASYAAQLRGRFPASREYQAMLEGRFE